MNDLISLGDPGVIAKRHEAEGIRKIVVKQIESVEKMQVTDALVAACRYFAIENLKLVLNAIDERIDR